VTRLTATAPAKVNLTLHVTGQRDGGYHLLDSLVVFADVGDQLTLKPSPDLRLNVGGPFSMGVPADDRNLVMQAARALAGLRGVDRGATIQLDKTLPHSAGIGGGSSDAATALGLLAKFWNVAPLPADHPAAAALGADVPVCLSGPGPLRMRGIGDEVSPAPRLPDCALVLVNPKVETPTPAVFKTLTSRARGDGFGRFSPLADLAAQRPTGPRPPDRATDRRRTGPPAQATRSQGYGSVRLWRNLLGAGDRHGHGAACRPRRSGR
jgi:4-diphosphocytidyl-2-C-methyl-D-erythritol kinase